MSTLLTLLVLLSFAAGAQPAQAQGGVNLLVNPGFEVNGGTSNPASWRSSGNGAADYTEGGGHSGNYRLAHYSSASYIAETSQTRTGLTNGPHTLRVWVKSSGGQNEAYIALKNCGSPEARTAILQTSPTEWMQLTATINVTNGQCTVAFYSNANAGNWANFDDAELVNNAVPTPTATATPTNVPLPTPAGLLPIRGADVSSLDKSEALGGSYRYRDGTPGDALAILDSTGLNFMRLRVWVNPADGYHTKQRILPVAQRAKTLGIGVLVDFHYSDFWADPGRPTGQASGVGKLRLRAAQGGGLQSHTRGL